MAHLPNAPQAQSLKADFSGTPPKWQPRPCYWAVPPAPIVRKPVTRRRCVMVCWLSLDETDKKIWARCLKRSRPEIAQAMRDPFVQGLITTFNSALVVDYD